MTIEEPTGSVSISATLARSGCTWSHVPFSREGWTGEFPDDLVETIFGSVPVRPETVDMPDVGMSLIGLIRPTLENPAYVVRDGENILFHRPVLGPDGGVRGYATVELSGGRVRVYVSEEFADLNEVTPVSGDLVAEADDWERATFKCLSMPMADRHLFVTDFNLASVLMGWGRDFFKADHGPIPSGARWITVHPNGEGSKGVPVLVQPASDGSGTFRVIGGAGGKLNMLKLRGVKSEAEYRQQHAERAADKRKANKDQIRKDKELGIHDAKVEARKQIDAQRREAQKGFISTVAEAMGWSDEDLHLDTSGLSEEAAKKAEIQHHNKLMAKAKEAVDVQRKALVSDMERMKSANLGTVPMDAGIDALSVQDLDPVRLSDGSGIDPDFKARAEAKGLTADKLDAQVASIKGAEGKASPDPAKAMEKGEIAKKIRDELKSVQEPDLKLKVADAEKAVALIKARKQLAAMERAAREAKAEVSSATVEPKAYVLSVSDVDDAEITKSIEDDLRTSSAKAFLAGVEDAGGEEAVENHIGTGAFNALDAIGQAVGGASLLDRSVVDVLGVAGAVRVLANRLHAEYGDEIKEIASGLAEYHVAHSPELQKDSLSQAKALQDAAAQIELDTADSAMDLVEASALNRKRVEHLNTAKKVLGHALGEMEAHAAMVAALDGGYKDQFEVSLGKVSLDSAIKQLWALGLTDEDYAINRVSGNVFAEIKPSAMGKLAAPIDHDNMARVKRNLDIMKGAEDEDNWLPDGFAKRPDLGLKMQPGVAPSMAIPFDAKAEDLATSLRNYIGARTADGDRASDILADIQSMDFMLKVGTERSKEYLKAMREVVPNKMGKKLVRVEELAPVFDQYADDFVDSAWGGTRSTLNRQTFETDEVAQDALHRALSDEPAGISAYKPVGDLSNKDRSALRDWFYKNVAKESPEQASLRVEADKIGESQPERFMEDIFGEQMENPEWQNWKSDYDAAVTKANAAGLDWGRYTHLMRGKVRAFEAIQDLIRSRVSEGFANHYNTLRPDSALKVGRAVVRNNLNHLSAVDPAEREARMAQERKMIDTLRNRVGGKYSSGSVGEKLDAMKAHAAAFGQAQMGFFSSDDFEEGTDKPLGNDERHTIGHAAESVINKMMDVVGKNFEPGKPVKLFNPSMSGPEGVKRQRMIKLIAENKRVIAGAGVGSGKTAIGIGAFSHLHEAGKIKKGLFVVPSIVQGQFGAEALRFLEAGKYNWHAKPGASYEERLASYKDPENHFSVVTHQSFRDDVLRMATEAGMGSSPEDVADAMAKMSKEDRKAFTKAVLDHHGINWDYVMADEAHGLLNREGKENSRMSNAIEGVTDNAEYYVHSSGDPVKNDASEAFSLLQKMDGERYTDRDAFMRRYGSDTRAAKEGLQREMARHLFAFSLTPDVQVSRSEVSVPQSDLQTNALDAIEKHASALRIAKMTGGENIEAAKALAPGLFTDVPEEDFGKIARKVADSVGILKQTAIRRILDNHPASAKLAKVAEVAGSRKGQQGVVFAHSVDAVESIRKKLEADGHKVVTISGKDSAADKAAKIRKFNPDKGDPEADIIVCSDAGATGANLQSGRWLVQYDTPDTAMTHAQRQGRINRIGQKNAVELIDLVADHEVERRSRQRLANKYDLRDLMTSPLEGLDDTGLAYYLKQKNFGETKMQTGNF